MKGLRINAEEAVIIYDWYMKYVDGSKREDKEDEFADKILTYLAECVRKEIKRNGDNRGACFRTHRRPTMGHKDIH